MSLPTAAPDSRQPDTAAALVRLLGIVVASFVPYLKIVSTMFLSDDAFYVKIYSSRGLTDLPGLFHGDWSFGMWGYPLAEIRPLVAATFMMDWRAWGANPVGYHLTNILLHAVCSILVSAIARRLFKADPTVSALAGILFALQPSHVGAVAWITGRVDVVATMFYLAAILAYALHRDSREFRWQLTSIVAFAAALFSKEIAITLPFLVFVLELTIYRASVLEAVRRVAGLAAVLAAYLVLRTATLGSFSGPQYYLSGSAGYVFFKSQPKVLVSLLTPFDLLLLLVRSRWAFALLIGIATLALLLARRRIRVAGTTYGRTILYFGLMWYAVTALPMLTTNEELRRYYLPSVGICISIAMLVSMIRTPALRAVVSVVLVFLSALSLGIRLSSYKTVASAAEVAHTALVHLASSTNGRSLVITALPAWHEANALWSTTNPIMYKPPFAPFDLTRRLTIVESPSAYVTDSAWRTAYATAKAGHFAFDGNACAIAYFDSQTERAIVAPEQCKTVHRMLEVYIREAGVPVPNEYYGVYTRRWNAYWIDAARDRQEMDRFPVRDHETDR